MTSSRNNKKIKHHNKSEDRLWASLYLPGLLLDEIQHSDDALIAIIERKNHRQQIRSCNDKALKAGLFPGMPLNSAYAIAPDTTVVEYDPDREAVLLQQVGEWAMRFSSIVCVHSPNHILIEIAGSKRLFEGYEILAALVQKELKLLGYTGQMGIAPTPLAANVLARANIRRGIVQAAKLPSVLNNLPVDCLELESSTLDGLRRSGIRQIGHLLTVSSASLTRRFGPACTKYLDCLLGHHPDPRTPLRLTDFFERKLDLPLEVENTGALQFATQRMINELTAFLIAHDSGVNLFTLTLCHEKHSDTTLQLRFLQATSQAKHLHRVLSEQLSQTTLPAPVCGLRLAADTFCKIERDASDLFDKTLRQQNSLGEIIDKLSSRLGNNALYTLTTVDDHRPEKAWGKSFPETQGDIPSSWPERPLWLLEKPAIVTNEMERYLKIESEAERIETGWWDNNDVRRDYVTISDNRGTRYWAFKQRGSTPQLFIHGIFA